TQDKVLGYAFVSRSAAQGLEPAKDTLAQLDQLMPAADRQKGAALARSVPTGSPVPSKPVKVAVAKTRKPTAPGPAAPRPAAAKPAVPKASPVPMTAPAATPATGSWRIQLGAFSQRGAAEALYQRVSGK